MAEMYAAVYLAPRERRPPPCAAGTAAAFYRATESEEFPYDGGDDPAFFAARYHNGAVTWGVCRPDVRCALRPDDWMVFFSAEQEDQSSVIIRYRFVAALCVEEKIAHTAIFQNLPNSLYRDYLNLLVRPNGKGWEHYEPGLNPSRWHHDWLWRICRRRQLRKSDLIIAGQQYIPGTPFPEEVAANYIIFSRSSSLIALDPPLVATHRRGEHHETWETDARSMSIRNLVFGNSSRGLRTANRQQPHRHFRRQLEDSAWPSLLRDEIIVGPPKGQAV